MKRKRRKLPCPHCAAPMSPQATGCRACSPGGRRRGIDHAYAASLGISVRHLRRIGGEDWLRSLSPEIRTLMLKPFRLGNSREVHKGGLKARGMKSCIPARLTQPQAS